MHLKLYALFDPIAQAYYSSWGLQSDLHRAAHYESEEVYEEKLRLRKSEFHKNREFFVHEIRIFDLDKE